MDTGSEPAEAPAIFLAAVERMRGADTRSELSVREIPAPGRIAPWSYAVAADVGSPEHGRDSERGTGRFILMHDPEEPESWGGSFRVVTFTQATQDLDIAPDPMLPEVTWSWLLESLDQRDAGYHAASGTATRVLSTGFGELAEQGEGAQLELRASWTPTGHDIDRHLAAWCDLVCAVAGLPLQPGAISLDARRLQR
ncbi:MULTISPECIES: DUF3000 domain-containing protein [unclassified Agrococcus]|uniref:DUF3000 domain-containing protein n=1 Tax=unclassified Agrococcus TaxID=2615065 RepID=UPI003619F34E